MGTAPKPTKKRSLPTPRYEPLATKALQHALQPATPEQTCTYWRSLDVTRQTAWNWRNDPSRIPLTARLAAAWIIHEKGGAA